MRAAKAKAEYDEIKQVYDQEFRRDSEKLSTLKHRAEAAGKSIKPDLLERYMNIKQHARPADGAPGGRAVRRLLHVAALGDAQADSGGRAHVACDNCGRILYQPPEG